MDVPMMTQWMMEEKDAAKIFEMRDEMLALVGCWANVHYSVAPNLEAVETGGRWLMVDETGGLLVAAMAERMGILYPPQDLPKSLYPTEEQEKEEEAIQAPTHSSDDIRTSLATSNTLTLLHNNAQPNLSLLKYFNFAVDTPNPTHPLTAHLHTLSWLQLISPELDTTYSMPPPSHTPEELLAMKSGKRGTYYRKRRRWARTKSIVEKTRNGAFSGLVIAAAMDPISILRHTIPLLAGGAPISIYSPTIEPLTALADLYSTSRRTAFIQAPPVGFEELSSKEKEQWQGDEDFPLNPTLVLGASVQTSRVRNWQVLPGRTHPEMTGRGGAEGYLFTGVKVLPAEGKVEARGKYRRKKAETDDKTAVVKAEENGAAPESKKRKIETVSGDAKTEVDIKMEDVTQVADA